MPSRHPLEESDLRPPGPDSASSRPVAAFPLAAIARVLRIPLACALLALGACGTIAPQGAGDGAPVVSRTDAGAVPTAGELPSGVVSIAGARCSWDTADGGRSSLVSL